MKMLSFAEFINTKKLSMQVVQVPGPAHILSHVSTFTFYLDNEKKTYDTFNI